MTTHTIYRTPEFPNGTRNCPSFVRDSSGVPHLGVSSDSEWDWPDYLRKEVEGTLPYMLLLPNKQYQQMFDLITCKDRKNLLITPPSEISLT